jgi:hypothetical protein
MERNRTDETSSDVRRGTRSIIRYDDIDFICEWRDRMPDNIVTINNSNIIVIKNEEPAEEDV